MMCSLSLARSGHRLRRQNMIEIPEPGRTGFLGFFLATVADIRVPTRNWIELPGLDLVFKDRRTFVLEDRPEAPQRSIEHR